MVIAVFDVSHINFIMPCTDLFARDYIIAAKVTLASLFPMLSAPIIFRPVMPFLPDITLITF